MYFPFPVLNGAENNMDGFALKENDSLSCASFSEMCLSFEWHSTLGFWSPFRFIMKNAIYGIIQEFLTRIFSYVKGRNYL